MPTNCFRFAPRDCLPSLIAKICKYLKDHPGWSEEELEEQIKRFMVSTGVESFNGRTGDVVLDENDINDLRIALAYFAEGDESIDDLNLDELYNNGVRFVFTNWNSVTSGYDLSFVLEYFAGSNNVVYYPMSAGSGGGSDVLSVNGKTGIVELNISDILGDSGAQVKLCTAAEFTANTLATWNAYYEDGYRIVGVVNSSATAIDYIYFLMQDENNHRPIGLSAGASDAYTPTNPPPYPVTSVNGKTGAIAGLYDSDNPPPYPVTSVNGKTGAISGIYDGDNPPPYPVTSVNGKTGAITGLYDGDNPPPYPVTSVNGKTGDITGLYDADNQPPYPVTSVNGSTGNITGLYSGSNPPPYPVTSVFGLTGAIGISSKGGMVEAEPGELNISVTQLTRLSIGNEVGNLPGGSSITRYIITDRAMSSGAWQRMVGLGMRPGALVGVDGSGTTSDGHGFIRMSIFNVSSDAFDLKNCASVLTLTETPFTVIGFTRYVP